MGEERRAILSEAILNLTNFLKADPGEADLPRARLRLADLQGADLRDAKLNSDPQVPDRFDLEAAVAAKIH